MSNLEATALISTFINSIITLFKFMLAGFSGSIALLADAWHSFSDIFSSLGVFIALRMDKKEKDSLNFKQDIKIFRQAGWETKVALAIGLFLLFVCWEIFLKIISRKPIIINYPLVIAMGVLTLAFFSYLLYRYEFYVGKINNSPGLIADGYHSKIDMYASIVVAFNLVSSHFGFDIDKPVAFVICIFVFTHAWHILIDSLRSYSKQRSQIIGMHLAFSLEDVFLLFLRQKIFKLINRFYAFVGARIFGLNETDKIKHRLNRIFLIFLILVLLIFYFASGFFIVKSNEEAIVERFGEPKAKVVNPGLHYHLPFPIEKAKVIATKKIRTQIIGSKEIESNLPILWTNLHTNRETFFITGDFSLLDANLYLHYNIKDLYAYFYDASFPEKLLEALAYAHMRALFGKRPFFFIVTQERTKLEEELKSGLQNDCDRFSLGLNIVAAKFKDMHTPPDVSSSFEEVGVALEDWQTYVNEARGYRDDILPKAKGEAIKSKEEALARQKNVVACSIAETSRFKEFFRIKKDIFNLARTQTYLETLEEVLVKPNKFIIPSYLIKESELWIFDERSK